MRRFFINQSDVSKSTIIVRGNDAKHIKSVLRLGPGDNIALIDGTGIEYTAKIKLLLPEIIHATILTKYSSASESPLHLTVAQAFLKDKKMDRLVKSLTELGITNWIPFTAHRSVSIPNKKRLESRIKRWVKISQEAAKQCERGKLPSIQIDIETDTKTETTETISFKDIIKYQIDFDIKIIFWENEVTTIPFNISNIATSTSSFSQITTSVKKILIILGPEGGFTPEEIQLARSNNFQTFSLGPRILRSETAAIAATTLIQYFFGDMGEKIP